MNPNVKITLDELKKIEKSMHDAADSLHRTIHNIEVELDLMKYTKTNDHIEKYLPAYIKTEIEYRKDLRKIKFDNLPKREDELWDKIAGIYDFEIEGSNGLSTVVNIVFEGEKN